jgi:hypothetical protein
MIPRRVITHFRQQAWTAIAIDFVIVVAGVFVGIQVANWNTDRQNRALAHGYLQRLHHEVVDLIANGADATRTSEATNRHLHEVQNYLNASDGVTPALSARHCGAIARSHVYARGIILPPTLGELLATGRVLLIDDETLRTSIASYAQSINDIGQLRDDIQIDRLPLARKYPELITRRAEQWDQAVCSFGEMRRRDDFRNDLSDNINRFGAYAVDVLARQRRLQQALHAQLDRRLDIRHESTSPPGAIK